MYLKLSHTLFDTLTHGYYMLTYPMSFGNLKSYQTEPSGLMNSSAHNVHDVTLTILEDVKLQFFVTKYNMKWTDKKIRNEVGIQCLFRPNDNHLNDKKHHLKIINLLCLHFIDTIQHFVLLFKSTYAIR